MEYKVSQRSYDYFKSMVITPQLVGLNYPPLKDIVKEAPDLIDKEELWLAYSKRVGGTLPFNIFCDIVEEYYPSYGNGYKLKLAL